jgi:hypothetical protein
MVEHGANVDEFEAAEGSAKAGMFQPVIIAGEFDEARRRTSFRGAVIERRGLIDRGTASLHHSPLKNYFAKIV